MLLFRAPYRPAYQFLIELKYLKKGEEKKLEKVTEEAVKQVKGYLADPFVRQLEDLKCWVVVFVGDEAKAVKEVLREEKA